jgi:hypothetical protein
MEGFSMPANSKKSRGGNIHLGWAPLDDPRYTGGWNFLIGKNLNPQTSSEQAEAAPPIAPRKPRKPRRAK